MKIKLIFLASVFFGAFRLSAQKLTPEILNGKWQAVALHIPNEIFFNSLSDSFVLENKQLLKKFQALTNGNDSLRKVYSDSVVRQFENALPAVVFVFDSKGNLISQKDGSPLFHFLAKKEKFVSAVSGRSGTGSFKLRLENTLLVFTLPVGSTFYTYWLQKQ